MDNSPRDELSPRDYEEIPSRDPITDLNSSANPQSIRDFQTKLQDLNRENFDLKLRIFFLEQNGSNGKNSTSTPTQRLPRPPSQFEYYSQQDPYFTEQTGYENEQLRSSLSPIRRQPNSSTNNENDELHSLRNRNGKDRRPIRSSGEFGEYETILNIDPTTQTFVTTPPPPPTDSNSIPPMPTSTYNLQFEERERKIQDENNLLKKENSTLKSRLNETSDQLKQVNEQYQQGIRNNEKTERVLKRMKEDYDGHIANLEAEQKQKLADYESYRHEQDHTTSNVNIEEYLRKIDQQDRLIKQLNDRLNGAGGYQHKPYTVLLPSTINPQTMDENTRRLNEYAETIDQLRAECDELRRSEKYLRRQVDDLNRLFEPSNGRLPPRPSIIDDVQQVEDPQSAIVQTSLQLRNDAENVSSLTNRIAQMIREREDNQNKLKEKDTQIRQYETRETEFENRTLQKSDLQIKDFQDGIRDLEKEIDERDRRLKKLAAENAQLRSQPRQDTDEFEIDDRRKPALDTSNVESLEETIHQQEKQLEDSQTELQEMENKLQQQRVYLERERDFEKGKNDQTQNELDTYKRRYTDLQNQYEKLRPILDEQRTNHEKQIQKYQDELVQIEQERNDLNEELQLLRHEKERLTKQNPENDPKFIELKEQISRYEVRFHDSEDENKRYQNELTTLRNNYQTALQQFDDLKVNHTKVQDELTSVAIEKETENQTLNEENNKLKHELEEIEIQIRLQINQEYENEYHNRYNELNEQKDSEIENALRDKETIEFELERVAKERKRFENELQKANETIENYERDIDRLREDLNRSKENNEQIERELSQTYSDRLKDQNDRIQDLEQQLQSSPTHHYEQLSPPRSTNNYEQSNFNDNDRYTKRSNAPTNQELIYQLENKLREQDDVIQSLRNSRAFDEGEPREIELALQIQIKGLERDLQTKEGVIKEYTQTVQVREQQIEKLLENLQQGSDSAQIGVVETLREELENRNQRFDEILDDRNSKIDQCERQITELQFHIKEREGNFTEIKERLAEAEQKIDEQQLEIDDLIRQKNRLTIVPEDREAYLIQIQDLEKEIQMEKKINDATPSEQRERYGIVIEDLRNRLKQRDDSIQRAKRYSVLDENLQRSLRASDEQLKDTQRAQHKMASDVNRVHLHADELTSDVENRDQMIASLRQKLAEKDQEINKLHENNLAKEQKLNELYSKMIETEPDVKRRGGERAPNNVQLKIELQRKEEEINDLRQRLGETQREKPDQTDVSTVSKEPRIQTRSNFDHLNREELLFELDAALQHNEDLNDQLRKKFPTITELHSQLVEVRHELSRQKYVNQVLWRKLNALIDIYGSNTRNELAVELANYQDELNKLKSQQTRTNDTRSAIMNANSRSSSEQNLSILHNGLSSMSQEFPSKNIRSTIALLERSNIEWQTKLARLTEQLGRSESQSRNYHREMIKYQKLLSDAGLADSSVRQRRRSADDSVIIGLNESDVIQDDPTNLDDLKEIIRNQRKYNQQLQTRIRLNTPDIIQSSAIEKLQEEIHNLNLVIETYKNESNVLKNELKKLYKTIESNRKTIQQYEQLLKDQQLTIEQSKKKLSKYDVHFDHPNEHFLDSVDEYIINLDIDILPGNDKKKQTSLAKKDSGFSGTPDFSEQQRQIRDKDEQIRNLNNQLRERDAQIQKMITELNNLKETDEDIQHQNRNDDDRIRRDLSDELQEARLQLDTLKTIKPQYEQAEEQNQKLRVEIKQLQNEIERNKPLLEHYKTQLDILEQRVPSLQDNDPSEMIIRSSELSQLLKEMGLLRRDLELSLQKQNELKAKLDENIRQTQSPREFTFTGRGVSYPDLRLIDSSSLLGTDNLTLSSPVNGKHSRLVGSPLTEFEQTVPLKSYIVGELRTHNDLRRLVEDIKFDLKATGQELKDKLLHSRTNSSITDGYIRSLDERFISLDERLTHALDLIETYWRADLPEKNKDNEHVFIDQRLLDENKQLLAAQRKYIRDTQSLREKYVDQSKHLDQLLSQLTKANRRKADSGEYLALLLRPTLDVLQKARSNIENHLKETNTNHIPPGSAQSHRHRRHRSNRED